VSNKLNAQDIMENVPKTSIGFAISIETPPVD
jgi:hypothetical protein